MVYVIMQIEFWVGVHNVDVQDLTQRTICNVSSCCSYVHDNPPIQQ